MGFFDKLKASVGIGGATVHLDAPTIATSTGNFRVDVAVRAGKLEQKLDGIDATLTVWRKETKPDGQTSNTSSELWRGRIDTAGKPVLRPGDEHRFESVVEAPALQDLYEDPQMYLQLIDDPEELRWRADGPLPFADYALPALTLTASADIPGAIDPSASRSLFVIPEAARELHEGAVPYRLNRVGPMSDAELSRRLAGAYLACPINQAEQWFIWWSLGTRVVAWANLKAIVSVRPEGVVRTHTNPNVPKQSVLAKLPSETEDQRPGEMDEAFDWARSLATEAKLTVLPRPIGNAVFIRWPAG